MLMTQKEYILKILETLEDKWPIARWLKILVQGNALENTTIDSLIDIFTKMAEETKDTAIKDKLQKSKNILEQIKKIEREQHLKDEKSLNELDMMIQAL